MYSFTCTRSTIWFGLPIELIREVLLHLASWDKKKAGDLRLVCRQANVWILPLLFSHITLRTTEQISQFASILLPKRKNRIPLLKSQLHTPPRPLSTYSIESLAFVVNTTLPSVENALANLAPAFSRLKNLFITSRDLSSNAYWLRQHPIRPTTMGILHFGTPNPVNYRDPIFQCVTHLYTSTLIGHRGTYVTDLPQLTHLAVHTRLTHSTETVARITASFLQILETMPRLKLFVFVIDKEGIPPEKIRAWRVLLGQCIKDERFVVLPHFLHPELEWNNLLTGQPNVWERALNWQILRKEGDAGKIARYWEEVTQRWWAEKERLNRAKPRTLWAIDMVEQEDRSHFHVNALDEEYSSTGRAPKYPVPADRIAVKFPTLKVSKHRPPKGFFCSPDHADVATPLTDEAKLM
ncbi:hypothetical protein H0H92_011948, partial [Tricholoma furcatifolium]